MSDFRRYFLKVLQQPADLPSVSGQHSVPTVRTDEFFLISGECLRDDLGSDLEEFS